MVFHDPTHAELFDGTAPLVLAGHAHERQTVVLDEGTRIMVQGSTGGAGLRALEGEEPTPVTLSVLYLDPDTRQLVAWDDITLGGLGLPAPRSSGTRPTRTTARTDEPDSSPARIPGCPMITVTLPPRTDVLHSDHVQAVRAIRTGLVQAGPTPYAWPVPDGDEPRASRPGVAPIV